jgi:hypothetical protein
MGGGGVGDRENEQRGVDEEVGEGSSGCRQGGREEGGRERFLRTRRDA